MAGYSKPLHIQANPPCAHDLVWKDHDRSTITTGHGFVQSFNNTGTAKHCQWPPVRCVMEQSKSYNKSIQIHTYIYIYTNISSKFFALVRSVQLWNSLISTISILLPSKWKNGSLSSLSHTFTCESWANQIHMLEYVGFEMVWAWKPAQGDLRRCQNNALLPLGRHQKRGNHDILYHVLAGH